MSSRTSATWPPPGPACSAWPSCWPRSTPASPCCWPGWCSASGCAGCSGPASDSPRSASCSSRHEPPFPGEREPADASGCLRLVRLLRRRVLDATPAGGPAEEEEEEEEEEEDRACPVRHPPVGVAE